MPTPPHGEPKSELTQVVHELRAYGAWAQDAGLSSLGAAPAGEKRSVSATPAAAQSAPAVPAPVARATPSAAASRPAAPPPAAAAANPAPAAASSTSLSTVRADLGECTRCKLCKTRTNIVFGTGSPKARLVFVGEAPGEDEDLKAEPFVGKAGQLLTKMIEAMGLRREDVYICNTVKCRPPNNRNPEPDELGSCEPFLKGQLAAIRPEVIVALGKFAAQALLRDETPISRLRGQFRTYEGIPLMPTFHPAYLLRSPGEKPKVWSDLQQVMQKLGLPTPPPTKGAA